VGELDDLLQGKITLFKPTSLANPHCTFMALVICSLSTFPLVIIIIIIITIIVAFQTSQKKE